jgi:oligopeptidase B
MLTSKQEDDEDVPVKKGDYLYYKRTIKGKQYAIYCRKHWTADLANSRPEEILLNQNEMKEEYIVLGAYEPSPSRESSIENGAASFSILLTIDSAISSDDLLAYSLDTQGNEFYTIYVKDIKTGEIRGEPDVIANTDGTVEWCADSKSFYYMTLDAIQRPWVSGRIYRVGKVLTFPFSRATLVTSSTATFLASRNPRTNWSSTKPTRNSDSESAKPTATPSS